MDSRTRGEVLGAPHPPSAVRPGGWPAILVRKRKPSGIVRSKVHENPLQRQGRLKVRLMVVSSSIGFPPNVAGLYRHCRTASIAASTSSG